MHRLLAIGLLFSFTCILRAQETSILFIGNSFTFMNNMPGIFKQIAEDKGHPVYVDTSVHGGKNFEFHANRLATYEKIKSRTWDYIILQGHSNELAQPDSKVDKLSLPFAKQLVDSIHILSPCTKVYLYMTWGYKNGNSKWSAIATYDSMQIRIKNQYLRFADLLNTRVSPVGEVWRQVRSNYAGINLYDPDLFHPNLMGSYLSACTHFASIFGESPVNNQAEILIDEGIRQIIEYSAASTVLNNLPQWRNVYNKAPIEAGFDLVLQNDSLQLIDRSKEAMWVEWNFGDGHISVDQNPNHCYASKGTYTITQTVRNACKTVQLQRTIEVKFTKQ